MTTSASTPTPAPTEPKLHNRELSWLTFNARVLQEAQSADVPLLERLKFLAIFSSNLDEYFKVRVATLRRLQNLKPKTRAKLGEDPSQQLQQVLEEVARQQEAFGDTFRNQLLPELRRHHIHLITEHDATEPQREWLRAYFRERVQDLLFFQVLDDKLHHLFLKDQAVYLTCYLPGREQAKKADKAERIVVMELPTKQHGSRFVELPAEGEERYVMFLDDVVRCCATELFPKYPSVQVHSIKISRDAELDIQEEVSGNLLAKIKNSLRKRETGYPARLLYDPAMPKEVLRAVMQKTGIGQGELVAGSRYHNFRDFFGFPGFGLSELQYAPQPALPHPTLPRAKTDSLLAAIGQHDHLVHYPYQSFDHVTRLLREAAKDPDVTDVSITLYRVGGKSEVAKALLKAAKNGKRVTAVVELKARFDEESNIRWAEKLEKAGANVIYSAPELKVHAKLLLITRRQPGQEPQYFAYLSTGNFNESTAGIYADHGLLTADPRLTGEVARIFESFRKHQPMPELEHLLVAPVALRTRLLALIDAEIANAREGREAYIILKLNALQDEGMIRKLYEASQAGVRIELLIRGISCLVPGQEGQSRNISQHGIVDRYLEHARVYVFANGGQEKVYIASADWMSRNLDRRVEVAFPLYDDDVRREIRHLLDLQRQDNTKSRDWQNQYVPKDKGTKPVRAQAATYDYLKKRSRTARPKPKPEQS